VYRCNGTRTFGPGWFLDPLGGKSDSTVQTPTGIYSLMSRMKQLIVVYAKLSNMPAFDTFSCCLSTRMFNIVDLQYEVGMGRIADVIKYKVGTHDRMDGIAIVQTFSRAILNCRSSGRYIQSTYKVSKEQSSRNKSGQTVN
jgi:hypothetical protein